MPTDTHTQTVVPDLATAGAVEAPGGFRPDIRQRTFKAIAIESSEEGRGFLRDWLKRTRYCPFPGGQLHYADWNAWLKQDGFKAWFYDFPFPRTVSEEDIESMDYAFWEAMRDNLSEGEHQSMKLYAQLTGKLNKRDEDEGANSQVVVWLEEGRAGAAAWSAAPKGLPGSKD